MKSFCSVNTYLLLCATVPCLLCVLQSKLVAATNECTSLTMKLQKLREETERDIESRIQVSTVTHPLGKHPGHHFFIICFLTKDAIEKYKSLPAELESMQAVLDMKNEENRQLKKGQMELKMEVNSWLFLEDGRIVFVLNVVIFFLLQVDHLRNVAERAKKLQYENESLSFVVENKSKFERFVYMCSYNSL